MRLTIQVLVWLCCLSLAQGAQAVAGGLSYGKGLANLRAVRMAVTWDLGPWFSKDDPYHWHGYWEASAARWRSSTGNIPNGRDTTSVLTTGPQIRYEASVLDNYGLLPFVELGVGLSWMSKTNIGGRRMDMHFQFEDRLGLGFRWGEKQQYETIIRGFHYSNASLGKHNSGMNILMLSFNKWFD